MTMTYEQTLQAYMAHQAAQIKKSKRRAMRTTAIRVLAALSTAAFLVVAFTPLKHDIGIYVPAIVVQIAMMILLMLVAHNDSRAIATANQKRACNATTIIIPPRSLDKYYEDTLNYLHQQMPSPEYANMWHCPQCQALNLFDKRVCDSCGCGAERPTLQ